MENAACFMSQPTLQRGCEKAKLDGPKRLSPREKTSRVVHQRLFEENTRKTIKGLRVLKMRVWEFFTHGEGISTPHAHCKGRQPLIECAKYDFKIVYFPFYISYFFGVDMGFSLTPTYP